MFDKYTSAGKLYKKVVTGFIVVTVIATSIFYSYLTKQNSRRSNAAVGDFSSVIAVPSTTIMQDGQEYTTTFQFEASSHPMAVQGYDMNIAFDNTYIHMTHIKYTLGQVSQGLGDTDADIAQVNTRGSILINGEVPSTSPPIITAGTNIVSISYMIYNPRGIVIPDFSTLITLTGNFEELHADNTLTFMPINQLQVTAQTTGFTPAPISPTPSVTCIPPPACVLLKTCEIAINPDWCPIGNTVLGMKLKFQGITSMPKITTPMPVQLKIVSAQTGFSVTKTVDFSSDDTGTWIGATSFDVDTTLNPVGTKFSIYVKGPKHLKKRICTTIPSEVVPGTYACAVDSIPLVLGVNNIDASRIYQLAGDLPVDSGQQNGLIDSEDTSYIRLHYGDSSQAVLDIADLNLDGAISTQDFSLVIAALGVKYDDPEETLQPVGQ